MSDPFAAFSQDLKASMPQQSPPANGNGAASVAPAQQPVVLNASPQAMVQSEYQSNPYTVAEQPNPASPPAVTHLNPFDVPAASQQPAVVPPADPWAATANPPVSQQPPVEPTATSPPNPPAAADPWGAAPTSPVLNQPNAAPLVAAPPSPPANDSWTAPAPQQVGVPPSSPPANNEWGVAPTSAPPPTSPPPPAPVPYPSSPPVADPFAAAPISPVQQPPSAPPLSPPPADPWAAAPISPVQQPPSGPPSSPPPADPWAAAPISPVAQQLSPASPVSNYSQAPVSPPQQPIAQNDPFDVFGGAAPPVSPQPAVAPQAQAAPTSPLASAEDAMWAEMGFSAPTPVAPTPVAAASEESQTPPTGGEYYDVKIYNPALGVLFFRPQQLKETLYLNMDQAELESLRDRPVVAHILEGSDAKRAGIELGHIVHKVNGIEVHDPEQAARLIREGPRPLPLVFYVPNTNGLVMSENEHLVKYDSKELDAPATVAEWKPKYVVIGGPISLPYLINMYRSKSEYDTAVLETQLGRPISVKVKQFSLHGARIINGYSTNQDNKGIHHVKYRNKAQAMRYIVILPAKGKPIKISSFNIDELIPVQEGCERMVDKYGHISQRVVKSGPGGDQPLPEPKQFEYPDEAPKQNRVHYYPSEEQRGANQHHNPQNAVNQYPNQQSAAQLISPPKFIKQWIKTRK